jgi:hypothetical protein
MKLVSKALLAAGLVALSACGGGEENTAANNTAGEDLYNVAPDDLTLDNGLGNDLGNVDLGNDLGAGNTTDTGNTTTETNTVGNTQ